MAYSDIDIYMYYWFENDRYMYFSLFSSFFLPLLTVYVFKFNQI